MWWFSMNLIRFPIRHPWACDVTGIRMWARMLMVCDFNANHMSNAFIAIESDHHLLIQCFHSILIRQTDLFQYLFLGQPLTRSFNLASNHFNNIIYIIITRCRIIINYCLPLAQTQSLCQFRWEYVCRCNSTFIQNYIDRRSFWEGQQHNMR